MTPFDFSLPTRIVFGAGVLDRLGELARSLPGVERVLVVSDPGVVAAGHTPRGIDALHDARLETVLFDGVGENPTTEHVEAGLAVAREVRPDCIVGLGGGSSMDCAKGINFLYSCGGRMQDYWGVGKATAELLPMIAAPTTAGTGSETQSFALISDAQTHVKMACGDPPAAFRVALLDPELTLTQPARVAGLTGVDAIAHAVETAVTTRRSSISTAFSRQAWRYLVRGFPAVLNSPDALPGRELMQLGACFSGLAIANSMLGAAHALANPLTANYGIVHGEAVGLMLPHVVRHNARCDRQARMAYRYLLAVAGDAGGADLVDPGEALANFLTQLAGQGGLATRLAACGVEADRLPELADQAAKQWTVQFNPVAMAKDDLQRVYEQAF